VSGALSGSDALPTPLSQTLILANGTKGKRYAMKNARIMVNQPLGGVQGSFVDVRLQAAEQSRNIKVAREILHLASGKSRDDVGELLDREFFMCAWLPLHCMTCPVSAR
jgi:ATP-dependent Clp protease protease subunit